MPPSKRPRGLDDGPPPERHIARLLRDAYHRGHTPLGTLTGERFSASEAGELKPQLSLPEVDAFHFAPRVRIPTLLLGGRYDFEYPVELSQVPLFRALGAPADQKRHVVFETGNVPKARIDLTVDWLDRYLGPVR